jgi:DeoR/GlpR family transcriptional regulator of sugar metabolism
MTVRSAGVHAVDRRHRILERVAEDQTIHVPELARAFGVSEMTVRRDIARLERDGFVRRTYGGATAHLTRSFDLSFNARALQHAREKRLIGMRATELLGPARTIYVGIGTTAEQFAQFLPARADLTVATSSLPVASLLGTRAVRVVALGGTVVRDELNVVGTTTLRSLGGYRFDCAFIGAAGIATDWGVTELTDDDAEVQRSVVERSERVVVMADGSKLGRATSAVVCPVDRIATVITDRSAPGDEILALRRRGVEVITVRATRESTAEAGTRARVAQP